MIFEDLWPQLLNGSVETQVTWHSWHWLFPALTTSVYSPEIPSLLGLVCDWLP